MFELLAPLFLGFQEVKVAFIGDQENNSNTDAVYELIVAEGADALVIAGDFDYGDDPDAWAATMNQHLPMGFPVFAACGNHDDSAFFGGGGYQDKLEARMNAAGIPWSGSLGELSWHSWQGIFFVASAPDVLNDGDGEAAPYLAAAMDQNAGNYAWRVGFWHVVMEAMQVGGKSDQSGWDLYEFCRQRGAICATAHEHSYARTHLLSSMENQVVADDDFDYELSAGQTIAFHSGLGGNSIRDQERCLPESPPYGCNGEWASIYTSNQGADFGALFITFNHQGDPCRARGYFKSINGEQPDVFFLTSRVGPCAAGGPVEGACCVSTSCTIRTASQCSAQGGVYQGNGSDCSPNPCTAPPATGACCVGTSCTVATASNCSSMGGTYQGNGVACTPTMCEAGPQVGACCLPLGVCLVLPELLCIDMVGDYQGDGTTCTPGLCDEGGDEDDDDEDSDDDDMDDDDDGDEDEDEEDDDDGGDEEDDDDGGSSSGGSHGNGHGNSGGNGGGHGNGHGP